MHAVLKRYVCVYFVVLCIHIYIGVGIFQFFGGDEIYGMGVIVVLVMVMVMVVLVVISNFSNLIW
jgi:hypothetical protein